MFLLISFIFLDKNIYIGPKLLISAGLLIYPFTFLILTFIYNKYTIKEAKYSIYISFMLLLVFYLIASIFNSIEAVVSSETVSESLRIIFTPNHFIIKNIIIYYPNLINLLTFSVIFFITHYIFVVVYEAIESTTNYLIGFILSILIGFILDQLLFTPLVSLPHLIDHSLSYNALIETMTANFIIVIFSSLVMLIIYSINQKKKKN
jgi:uncharacterized PurR-regulated membrane protein YhhQ (DUF165 family)